MVDYYQRLQGVKGLQNAMYATQEKEQKLADQSRFRELAPKAAQGDVNAIADLYALSPELAAGLDKRNQDRIAEMGAQNAAAVKDATSKFMVAYKTASPEQRAQMEQAAIENPMIDVDAEDFAQLKQTGSDIPIDFAIMSMVGTDAYKQMFGGGGESSAAQKEYEYLVRSGQLTDEEQKRAARIKLGLDPRAVASAESTIAEKGNVEQVAEVKQALKEADVTGKGKAETATIVINEGREAAKGIPNLRRSIALLDNVKTGGFDKVSMLTRQLFGVEGADEGELSANLGQAILGDLRATFGAAFTEKEGARLERIRANIGKSPEANKRLLTQALQLAEKYANNAIKRAVDRKDYTTAQEIQDALNFQFDFNAETQVGAQSKANDLSNLSIEELKRMAGL